MPNENDKYYHGEYFGPDNLPDFRGYYEDIEEVSPYRYLGLRLLGDELPIGRLPGANYSIEFELARNLELLKGHKTVVVKASSKRPLRVRSTIGILGGPRKNLQS